MLFLRFTDLRDFRDAFSKESGMCRLLLLETLLLLDFMIAGEDDVIGVAAVAADTSMSFRGDTMLTLTVGVSESRLPVERGDTTGDEFPPLGVVGAVEVVFPAPASSIVVAIVEASKGVVEACPLVDTRK